MTLLNINETVAEYTAEFEFHEALVYSLQDLGLKILQNMPAYTLLPNEDKDLLKRVVDNHAWATFFSSLTNKPYLGAKDLYLQKAGEVFKTLVDLTQVLIDRYDRIDDEKFTTSFSMEQLILLKEAYKDQYAEISLTISAANTISVYRERFAAFTIIALSVIIAVLDREKSNEFVDGINEVLGSLRMHQMMFNKSLSSQQIH